MWKSGILLRAAREIHPQPNVNEFKVFTGSVEKISAQYLSTEKFPHSTDPVDKILTIKKPYRQ